jgi:hypothetical protein
MFDFFWKSIDWLVSIGMVGLSCLWISKGFNIGYFVLLGSILILAIKIRSWVKQKSSK